LQPTFGGVNLEDIAAPQCFEIEERLRKICNIPIFHDDQHGTAIVTAAGLINALKLVGKNVEEIRVVANGSGAAGVAIVKLLLNMGVKDVILCDTNMIMPDDLYLPRQELKSSVDSPLTLDEIEELGILRALGRNKGNIYKTAKELNIARQTLYNKIQKHKL